MSSKAAQYNRNGDEMCHAFGCRKHKKLKYIFLGKFCKLHVNMLKKIRDGLYYSKKSENIELENYWRQKEIEFRKFHDPGHMLFKLTIEQSLD